MIWVFHKKSNISHELWTYACFDVININVSLIFTWIYCYAFELLKKIVYIFEIMLQNLPLSRLCFYPWVLGKTKQIVLGVKFEYVSV